MWSQAVGIESVVISQKVDHILVSGNVRRLAGGQIKFDAIAGRKEHGFDVGKPILQTSQGIDGLIGSEGQTFSHLDGRAVVAASDQLQLHHAPPKWCDGSTRNSACLPLFQRRWIGTRLCDAVTTRQHQDQAPVPGRRS